MTTRPVSIFRLVVGILWGLIVLGLVALFGGFFGNAPPRDIVLIGKELLSVWWLFAGPLLLLIGAVLTMGTRRRAGSILSLVGCLVLTVFVGYQIYLVLQNLADPLIARPTSGEYTIYAIAVFLNLIADLGAFHLYRLAYSRGSQLTTSN
jgi:hypothetical protein